MMGMNTGLADYLETFPRKATEHEFFNTGRDDLIETILLVVGDPDRLFVL
jgi:hypothetical protein